jgi:hypothetical protein
MTMTQQYARTVEDELRDLGVEMNEGDERVRQLRAQLLQLNRLIVVLKLVASCCWNCGLDKLSTILEMKTFHRQPVIHAAA